MFDRPLQENLSRQDDKAQRKTSYYFSELGVLCVFARVIFFRFGNSKNNANFKYLG
jgi:hypothetical protein